MSCTYWRPIVFTNKEYDTFARLAGTLVDHQSEMRVKLKKLTDVGDRLKRLETEVFNKYCLVES